MSKGFHCITGAEDFLVNRKGKELWARMTEGVEDDFAKEIVEGDALKVEEVAERITHFQQAVETMPMFGGRKLVWFKGITFLADNKLGQSESTLEALDRLKSVLENLNPESVGVLLTASPVDRRRAFYKFLLKSGETEFLAEPSGRGGAEVLAQLVEERCQEEGVRIQPQALDALVARVGGSTRLVYEEISKLATYLSGESAPVITPELVMDLVPVFGEGDFFETTEALYSKNPDWVLAAVEKHFFVHSSIRPLLSSWQNRNRLLIQLRVLLDSGDLRFSRGRLDKAALEQAAARYGSCFGGKTEKNSFKIFGQHPFYLGRLADAAQKFSLKTLLRWQTEFYRAFEETIQQSGRDAQVARSLVLRCLGES
ncbi:MAG: DNA polymerase III subunit delta [Opitutales bacterium]|nr:DNA polymerase III subunit delta [Opitutales bacterium]